jgi:hypothetical protein
MSKSVGLHPGQMRTTLVIGNAEFVRSHARKAGPELGEPPRARRASDPPDSAYRPGTAVWGRLRLRQIPFGRDAACTLSAARIIG